MLQRVFRRFQRFLSTNDKQGVPPDEATIHSQQSLIARLADIPYWEDKFNLYKQYAYDSSGGIWSKDAARPNSSVEQFSGTDLKVNYGCGGTILDGWINVDLFEHDHVAYHQVNLLEKHPFADGSVAFGYSEDMLEHLQQASSIFVIAEIYRALKLGGVMRFSFPGLEGVLKRHYMPASELRVRKGEFEAYAFWDHIHFYSKEELRLIAEHVGFTKVDFFEQGVSPHDELRGRDTRAHQMDLNTFAELTKQRGR